MDTEKLTKLSFSFNAEDMQAIEAIKEKLRPVQGPVSNVAAIRVAIRLATREAPDAGRG
jgi:hypothetical protein